MRFSIWCSKVVLLVVSLGLQCRGQAFHTVLIGDSGSFYNPPTISASEGDIVTFIYAGKSHSVTQSAFDSPCTRLEGGFDSDSWGVKNPGDPVPQWNLTITNDTMTIWFYCKNTLPQSHCTSGMVGAINPPIGTNETYDAFRQAAKAITGTPVATPGAILTGIGASATAVPSLVATAITTSTTSSSSSTSSSPSSTATPPATSPASSNKAAVVGGAVGGALGGVIVLGMIAAIFVVCRRRRRGNAVDAYSRSSRGGPPYPKRNTSLADDRSVSNWAASTPFTGGHRPADASVSSQPDFTPEHLSSAALSQNQIRDLAAEIATAMKTQPGGGNSQPQLRTINETSGDNVPAMRTTRPLPPISGASGGGGGINTYSTGNRSSETLPIYSGHGR